MCHEQDGKDNEEQGGIQKDEATQKGAVECTGCWIDRLHKSATTEKSDSSLTQAFEEKNDGGPRKTNCEHKKASEEQAHNVLAGFLAGPKQIREGIGGTKSWHGTQQWRRSSLYSTGRMVVSVEGVRRWAMLLLYPS